MNGPRGDRSASRIARAYSAGSLWTSAPAECAIAIGRNPNAATIVVITTVRRGCRAPSVAAAAEDRPSSWSRRTR